MSLAGKSIIAAVLGGGAGFLYYATIGCSSGSCPITSNPYITTLYGAAVGMFLVASTSRQGVSPKEKSSDNAGPKGEDR